MLTFEELRKANVSRLQKWHGAVEWTITDWSNATAGELGEMCNVIKKLRRIELGMMNINDRQISTRSDALREIGKEAADTLIYLDLLMNYLGLNLEDFIRVVFNQKSIEYNFPERL